MHLLNVLIEKKKYYASFLMSAIIMLHASLASISPHKLFESLSESGVDPYLLVMEVSETKVSSLEQEGPFRGMDERVFFSTSVPASCAHADRSRCLHSLLCAEDALLLSPPGDKHIVVSRK